MTKLDLIKRVIENEFDGKVPGMTEQQVKELLFHDHAYLFDKYYFPSIRYEGSEKYFQLYACISGVINDRING